MDFVTNHFQTCYKNVIDNLVSIHKSSKTDVEFSSKVQDTMRTFINNIHLTQSIMFSSIASNLKYIPVANPEEQATEIPVPSNCYEDPVPMVDISGLKQNVRTNVVALGCLVGDCLQSPCTINRHPTVPFTPVPGHRDSIPVSTVPDPTPQAKIIYSGTVPFAGEFSETPVSTVFIPRILNKDKDESNDIKIIRQRTIDDWIQTHNTEPSSHSHIPDHFMRYGETEHYTDYSYDDMDAFVTTESPRITPPPFSLADRSQQAKENKKGENLVEHQCLQYPTEFYEDPDEFSTVDTGLESDFDEEEELNAELALHCQDNMEGLKHRLEMHVAQCCARIGKQQIVIDEQGPEYMDNYPPDTYQDLAGFVYGLPCLSTFPIEDFETGTIFCKDHKNGYEDIRAEPSSIQQITNANTWIDGI